MLTQYFSRQITKQSRLISWLCYIFGWFTFFLSFSWGINRYGVSLITAFENYKEKEKQVIKEWNHDFGKWEYIRQKPSCAYKYIEIHLSHGKECAYCMEQIDKEQQQQNYPDTGEDEECPDMSKLLMD